MNNNITLKESFLCKYGTPCAVMDIRTVEKYIADAQRWCDTAGKANQSHINTHKSLAIAKMQLASGTKGITCRKLGGAEVMVDACLTGIIITTNLFGAAQSGRLTQ